MPDQCRHALISAFPQFSRLRMTVAGRGWDSLAIEIDGRMIAKFPQSPHAEAALRREASLLAAARPHLSLPVPDLRLRDDGAVLFSIHEKLPGSRLERDDYLRLAEAGRHRLAGDLGRFFAELHAILLDEMREAGAMPAEIWDTRPETLEPIWARLPPEMCAEARVAMEEYRELPPAEEVYGFFDAHGWNMAFDHTRGRLNGIFDFADSGLGPREREFVQVSLTHSDLARRAIDAYETITGRGLDLHRIFLLASAQRLAEFAGMPETDEQFALARGFCIEWFRQQNVR